MNTVDVELRKKIVFWGLKSSCWWQVYIFWSDFFPPSLLSPIKLRGWVFKALVLLKRLYSVFSRLAGCSILSWIGLLHGNWLPWYAWMYADYDYLYCETYLSDVNTDEGDYELWSYNRCVNPLIPNISMHILHTTPLTFTRVLIWRIFSKIKSFFCCWSSPLFSWP